MARFFPLELVTTPQVLPISGGEVGFHRIFLGFTTAPSAGTVTVEKRAIGSQDWEDVNRAQAVDVTGGEVTFYTDGSVSALRITFAGLTGGSAPVVWLASEPTAWAPLDLMTDGGTGPSARFRVDPGQTGFFARRMWSLAYEFASANPIAATPLVFRLVIPSNFIIHAHFLSVDQGGVTLRTYSADQGVAGGTFSTDHTPRSENNMTEEPAYAFGAVITSGGTFTPNGGESPITPLRVRTSGATAQQSSVGLGAVSEKGRLAGTYYAVLARMTGVSGDCTGVYNLVIEERPNGSQMPFP